MDDIKAILALFDYDPQSGVISSSTRRLDWQDTDGYRRVWLNIDGRRRAFMAHRLAWIYAYGNWPDGDIDHINGSRDDNRLSNLRCVDRRTNSQNQRKATKQNKTSGMLGVCFDADRKCWSAWIKYGGKNHRIGRFQTVESASAAYLEAKRRLHAGCTI
jgi:hypothetical protein